MNGGSNILPTMSAYGREMDHHHYNGLSSSGNSNVITGYPILYQNNHNHPAGDLLTLQMQLQGNASNNENENTLAALQRNWIALQQNNNSVGGNNTANNNMLHSSIHHPMTIPSEDMSYMRNLIPIGGNNSSPLHSNQSTLLDSLKFGSGLDPPNQVTQYGHHHHLTNANIQPSILDNSILSSNVGMSNINRNNPMNVTTSPNGRLQMPMNPSNSGLGVNVDMVSNNGMLSMNCNNSMNSNVIVNNSNNNSNIEWQGGIPIRNIPDLMTMLDLSDIPPHVQIPKYYEGIKISLGEAGREILRCYINQRGIRGKFMSSSNLQQLLRVAHQCGLWNAAVRLHLEFIGEIPMTASHAEMRKYKSLQTKRRLSKRISVLSKFGAPVVRRADGEETIEYRDGMKLSLGVDGRKLLLKRIRETRSSRENEINNLFSKYGLKYSQLRNATIHELCRMAYVCGLWEEAVKLHFQHIRKKAHENTTNQQESGSDLDSEMDINKDREEDIMSNNFLQQLHNPGIDILNVNNGNNSTNINNNTNNIAQNPVIGSIGNDSVHVSNTAHVHQHSVPHIQPNINRFGISNVGNNVSNSNSKNNDGNNISPNSSIINMGDNGAIHPSIVIPNNAGTSSTSHTLGNDHLNYDDYRNYILDGGNASNIDSTNLTSVRSGNISNISHIVTHDSRGSNNNNNSTNSNTGIGSSNNIINKVLGSNSNAGTGNVSELSNMIGLENENILGISTGALGAFVGNNSSNVSGNNISNYDGIGVTSNNNYDDYSLLSASMRKRGKTNNVDDVSNVDNNGIMSNIVAHPNTSSFVMETISGILGDETISNNVAGEKINYKSSNLSSVLGNDVNICQNTDVPQLSAVVVLAAAKAAEAAQNYDKLQIDGNNRKIVELETSFKKSPSDEKQELTSISPDSENQNGSQNESKDQNNHKTGENDENSTLGATSYPGEYSNRMDVSLESSILLNNNEQMLMNPINSKLLTNDVNKKYELINDNLSDNSDIINVPSMPIEKSSFFFPKSSNQANHKVDDGKELDISGVKNVDGISLVARGLTTQSTTDTSIESTGN